MKVTSGKIYKLLALFIILVEYDYFKLVGLGEIIRDSYIFILMLSIGVLCRIQKDATNRIKISVFKADCIVITFIICALLELFYTVVFHGSNLIDVFSVVIRWFTTFFIYPLMVSYEKNRENEEYLLKSIVIAGTLMYLIKIIIWFLYNYRGIVISPQIIFEYGEEWMRNNLLRLDDSSLMYLYLFSCLSFYRATEEKKYLVLIILQISFSTVIVAARSTTVALIGLTVFYYLIVGHNFYSKLKKYAIVAVVTIAIVSSSVFQNFVASFKLSGSDSSLSSVTRLNALWYYFNTLTKMDNPFKYFFGLGALSTNVSYEKSILRGPLGIYFIEDLGIVGFILQYGIIALVIILVLLGTFRKCSKHALYYNNSKKIYDDSILLIMCVFVPSILVQSIFDKSRIVALSFYVSLIIYYSKKNNQTKNKLMH